VPNFDEYDTNHDGFIDQKEFLHAFETSSNRAENPRITAPTILHQNTDTRKPPYALPRGAETPGPRSSNGHKIERQSDPRDYSSRLRVNSGTQPRKLSFQDQPSTSEIGLNYGSQSSFAQNSRANRNVYRYPIEESDFEDASAMIASVKIGPYDELKKRLHQIQNQLKGEQENCKKERGKSEILNATLYNYKERQKKISSENVKLKRALEETVSAFEDLKDKHGKLQRSYEILEGRKSAIDRKLQTRGVQERDYMKSMSELNQENVKLKRQLGFTRHKFHEINRTVEDRDGEIKRLKLQLQTAEAKEAQKLKKNRQLIMNSADGDSQNRILKEEIADVLKESQRLKMEYERKLSEQETENKEKRKQYINEAMKKTQQVALLKEELQNIKRSGADDVQRLSNMLTKFINDEKMRDKMATSKAITEVARGSERAKQLEEKLKDAERQMQSLEDLKVEAAKANGRSELLLEKLQKAEEELQKSEKLKGHLYGTLNSLQTEREARNKLLEENKALSNELERLRVRQGDDLKVNGLRSLESSFGKTELKAIIDKSLSGPTENTSREIGKISERLEQLNTSVSSIAAVMDAKGVEDDKTSKMLRGQIVEDIKSVLNGSISRLTENTAKEIGNILKRLQELEPVSKDTAAAIESKGKDDITLSEAFRNQIVEDLKSTIEDKLFKPAMVQSEKEANKMVSTVSSEIKAIFAEEMKESSSKSKKNRVAFEESKEHLEKIVGTAVDARTEKIMSKLQELQDRILKIPVEPSGKQKRNTESKALALSTGVYRKGMQKLETFLADMEKRIMAKETAIVQSSSGCNKKMGQIVQDVGEIRGDIKTSQNKTRDLVKKLENKVSGAICTHVDKKHVQLATSMNKLTKATEKLKIPETKMTEGEVKRITTAISENIVIPPVEFTPEQSNRLLSSLLKYCAACDIGLGSFFGLLIILLFSVLTDAPDFFVYT